MEARKAILHNKQVSVEVATDVATIFLCQALHKLPHEIEAMDPDWIWKFNIVGGVQQEQLERNSKSNGT